MAENAFAPRLLVLPVVGGASPEQRLANLLLAVVHSTEHPPSYTLSRFSGAAGAALSLLGPEEPLPLGRPLAPLWAAPAARAAGMGQVDALSSISWSKSTWLLLAASSAGELRAMHLDTAAAVTTPRVAAGVPMADGSSLPLTTTLARGGDVHSHAILMPTSTCAVPAALGAFTGAAVCVVQLALDDRGALYLRLWRAQPAAPPMAAVLVGNMQLVGGVAHQLYGSSAVSVAHDDASAGKVAIAWATGGDIFAATARWGSGMWKLEAGPARVGVGSAPNLAFTPQGEAGGVVMLVHGDGFCQQNEDHNKAGSPPLCGWVPTTTPGVLVSSYAEIAEFEAKLRRKELFSACDEQVMHGAYSQGAAPAGALFPLPEGSFGIAELHEGHDGSDVGSCGASSDHKGAVMLAGWRAANLTQ